MRRHLHSLWRDRRGMMAVEFAIVTPVLLIMLIGCFEITYALLAEARLRAMAHGVATLVAKQSSLNATAMADICVGGQIMMLPLPATEMSIAVTSVSRVAGAAVVDWQDNTCGTSSPISGPVAAASELLSQDGDSAILVRASYAFHSPTQMFLPSVLALTHQTYARPYSNETVSRP
jgi:Flp pilus assembly protein TadG